MPKYSIERFLHRQIIQIRQEGILVLFKKIYKGFYLIPVLLLSTLIVIIIRLLSPVVIIRFGELKADRIGHVAGCYELYLCERDAGMHAPKTHDIFYVSPPVCNYQLKKMLERNLHVLNFSYFLSLVNRSIPGSRKHIVDEVPKQVDVNNLLHRSSRHFFFTPEEDQIGKEELKKIGITKNDSFICFMGRDSSYLRDSQPDKNRDYHNYRDVDIQRFIPAMEKLITRDYFTVRMGAIVKSSLVTDNPKVIDYAVKHRTDFLDVYLSACCRFFVNGMAGFEAVPMFLFRRPMVKTNLIPYDSLVWGSIKDIYIFKRLWLTQERRFMTFREVFESEVNHFGYTEQYKMAHIEPIENTPEEISSVVIEMDERLKGSWQSSEEDEELQQQFWNLTKYMRPPLAYNLYKKYSGTLPQTRIGTEFLRQNKELLK